MAGAEVLFLCLPNGDVVESVLLGPGRLAERLAPGAVVVDLSTIAHAKAVAIGRALEATGRRFIDALEALVRRELGTAGPQAAAAP